MESQDIEINRGTWRVEISPDCSCFVYDPQGEKVHASRDHMATAVALAITLAKIRDLQLEVEDWQGFHRC